MHEYRLDVLSDALQGQPVVILTRYFRARGTWSALRKARRITRANVADRRTQYGEMYYRPVTGGLSVSYVATIEL